MRDSGTEKEPRRTFATKISPHFGVNFLVGFASKPLFYWIAPSNCSEIFFGTVRAIFWLWVFLVPERYRCRGAAAEAQAEVCLFFWHFQPYCWDQRIARPCLNLLRQCLNFRDKFQQSGFEDLSVPVAVGFAGLQNTHF